MPVQCWSHPDLEWQSDAVTPATETASSETPLEFVSLQPHLKEEMEGQGKC